MSVVNMERYRIQHRKFSSNVIEKRAIEKDGKDKWVVVVIPSERKEIGDKVCDELLVYFENKHND